MVAPRAAMPSVVSSKRASLPAPPSRTNSPSPTSRRRHERTCSALWPHASATAYRWEAATVPSSPTIPKTSVLVGISTVGSATIVILTTGTKTVNPRSIPLAIADLVAVPGEEIRESNAEWVDVRSGCERLFETLVFEEARRRVVGRTGDLFAGVGAHEVGPVHGELGGRGPDQEHLGALAAGVGGFPRQRARRDQAHELPDGVGGVDRFVR